MRCNSGNRRVGHNFAKPGHVTERVHVSEATPSGFHGADPHRAGDRRRFVRAAGMFAGLLLVQWLTAVIITARISPAHAPLASFIGAALALMSMAAVIVLGRRERRILDERTAALQDSEDRYRAIVDRAEGLF